MGVACRWQLSTRVEGVRSSFLTVVVVSPGAPDASPVPSTCVVPVPPAAVDVVGSGSGFGGAATVVGSGLGSGCAGGASGAGSVDRSAVVVTSTDPLARVPSLSWSLEILAALEKLGRGGRTSESANEGFVSRPTLAPATTRETTIFLVEAMVLLLCSGFTESNAQTTLRLHP